MVELFLAIFFVVMALCNFTNDKWFIGIRAKTLEGEKRKKFRRVQAMGLSFIILWLMAIFVVDELLHLEIGFIPNIILHVVCGILCICIAFFVEIFCYKKIKEESV